MYVIIITEREEKEMLTVKIILCVYVFILDVWIGYELIKMMRNKK